MILYLEGDSTAGQQQSIEFDPSDSDAVARVAVEAYRLVTRWAAEAKA